MLSVFINFIRTFEQKSIKLVSTQIEEISAGNQWVIET